MVGTILDVEACASGGGSPRSSNLTRCGADGGNCKDSACGQFSSVLLSGYCLPCAAKHNVDPMRGCGCGPVRLTQESLSGSGS